MHIVEASDADLGDVLFVERSAFGGEEEAELVRDLLDDPSAVPALSLLAREAEKPVGHILFTGARLVGRDDIPVAILAPLAVTPDAQRAGVGGRLIEDGIARLESAGVSLVFVLGHPDYYPRHGFVPALPLGLAAPYPITPEEAWMVRALQPELLGRVQGTVKCADAMDKPELWRE